MNTVFHLSLNILGVTFRKRVVVIVLLPQPGENDIFAKEGSVGFTLKVLNGATSQEAKIHSQISTHNIPFIFIEEKCKKKVCDYSP